MEALFCYSVTAIFNITYGTQDSDGRESLDILECQRRRNVHNDVSCCPTAALNLRLLLNLFFLRVE
jgi:hypothetical protein